MMMLRLRVGWCRLKESLSSISEHVVTKQLRLIFHKKLQQVKCFVGRGMLRT